MNPLDNNHQIMKDLPNENPFKVPEGYFEGFQDRLEAKMASGTSPEPKTLPLWRSYKSFLTIAAGFILFAAISYSLLHVILSGNIKTFPMPQHYADYIENEIHAFDNEILMQAYSESFEEEGKDEQELSDESLIDFLINEDIELDLIINIL